MSSLNNAANIPSLFGPPTAGYVLTSDSAGNGTWQPSTISPSFSTIVRQVFTTSGTYTPTTGMVYCDVEVLGGGGGGGGCAAQSSGTIGAASSGGSGGYTRKLFSATTIGSSQSLTVGGPGAGGAAGDNLGSPGGTSLFGGFLTATGGLGGLGSPASPGSQISSGGPGGTGSGGDYNTVGNAGANAFGLSSENISVCGSGGSSFFGGGAGATQQGGSVDPGNNATSFGGGGSGGQSSNSSAAQPGGNGFSGVVIVTEYCVNFTNDLGTLSDDVGTSITPTTGNIQLVGHVNEQGGGKFSTIVAGSSLVNINPMSAAKWIVDQLGFNGTHTTITAAIASVVAAGGTGQTILILDGVYNENFTLPAGINLCGLPGAQNNPNVVINGKITYIPTSPDKSSISNIFLQTNSDYAISITGSAELSLYNCYIQVLNNTAISISGGGSLQVYSCLANILTSGITLFSITNGDANFKDCTFGNSGSSTTASTIASGSGVQFSRSTVQFPLSNNGAGALSCEHCELDCGSINTAPITFTSGGNGRIQNSDVSGGTASVIVIGTGCSATVSSNTINSTNTNVFTGAGTINTGGNVCTNSSGNNVSTINHLVVI